MNEPINIFWFRRDLRLTDNTALYHALRSKIAVLPIFVFDKNILDQLDNKKDARVEFIHDSLLAIQEELLAQKSSLKVFYDTPKKAFEELTATYEIKTVFSNHDYEPYAKTRDQEIALFLKKKGIDLVTFKDQVIFEKTEIAKDDGKPYTVFTPYSRKWKATFNESSATSFPSEKYIDQFLKVTVFKFPSLQDMGFEETDIKIPRKKVESTLIKHYAEDRNFPGIEGTSRLGIHFRFGTISIRKAVARALELSPVFLNELIWRDFYQMILWNFPHVGLGKAFKPAYDQIEWRTDDGEFEKWCQGQTGYPIVDAGMRQLNETGFMHNRVRMIVASFLCKHLLLDWRLGEAYFAEKLLDFDLASNNGGWQWASGSGCDSAPYFRIFNPYLQTEKFDPKFIYIKKWVPEFKDDNYQPPIVDHVFARKRCLEVYSKALKNN